MSNVNVIDNDLISVQCQNVKLFFFEELSCFFSNYQFCYLLISHREYNRDFDVDDYDLIERKSDESFILSFSFNNNYSTIIGKIELLFSEFQHFMLVFVNEEIMDWNLGNSLQSTIGDRIVFFKSIEPDVVWIRGKNIKELFKK